MAMNVGPPRRRGRGRLHHQHDAARRRDAGAADHLPDHDSGRHDVDSGPAAEGSATRSAKRKPENIVISVDQNGGIYWNELKIANTNALIDRLKKIAVLVPQPEVQIRGDGGAKYDSVGRIIYACQRAGIAKVGFITEPPVAAADAAHDAHEEQHHGNERRLGPATRGEPEVMMDINTTPLIDVMLVLLVMLIITIPIQLHSVNLNMPTGNPPPPLVKPEVLKIDIDGDRRHLFQRRGRARSGDARRRSSRPPPQQAVQPELHLRPDKAAKYEIVAMVMASAQRLGLTKIGIVGSEQFIE